MATPTILSLCSGIGGLDLGLKRVLPSARTVGFVEREAFAASVLVARMEEQAMDPAPVWCGNLEDLGPAPFLGVDVIAAGFPCQPASVCGRRAGEDDHRWLWPQVLGLARRVAACMLVIENVPGLRTKGLEAVLEGLAEAGWDAEWLHLRASDVGATHRRDRLFLVAYTYRDGRKGERCRWLLDCIREALRDHADRQGGEAVGDARSPRLAQRGPDAEPGAFPAPWPPSPDDEDGWEAWRSAGGPEPSVRRGADGLPEELDARADRVMALGNAVVPAQAEAALSILFHRIMEVN